MKSEKANVRKAASPQNGGIYIMRIATVLLAIVSWWSTAQGMKQFVFDQEWQANLASLAIQAILLSLNFYLPQILKKFNDSRWRGVFILFTVVVLSCSSIFSYIFIANYTYTNAGDANDINAWDVDSQLLVQSAYREELYDANDYAEEYMESLQTTLSSQISELYTMADALEGDGVQATDNLDLDGDRAGFGNEDFVARTEMITAIDAMEAALAQDATESDRTQANTILSGLIGQINTTISDLQTRQASATANVAQTKNYLDDATEQLNNPPLGVDTNQLQEAYDTAYNNYMTALNNEQDLKNEQEQYQEALSALQRYQNYLGFSTAGAGQQISTALLNIQRGLFQSGTSEADSEDLEQSAVDIFEQLLSSNEDFSGDTTEYQSMLTTMDAFIQNLSNYGEVATIRDTLDGMISDLRTVDFNSEQAWQDDWEEKLNELKAQIGSLPIYMGEDEPELNQYSRTTAMNRLDNALRNYISGHNGAEQAFIYLGSPYRALAIFSLVLAYLLDIAAFITGFVIERFDDEQKQKDEQKEQEDNTVAIVPTSGILSPAALNHYLYLNGDYTKEDNTYRYCAVDGTYVTSVDGRDATLQPGYYLEHEGALQKVNPQQLAFAKMPSGPLDGVYQNCSLQYSDHMLLIKKNSEQEFSYLATVDQDVPVYRIQNGNCTCETLQDLRVEEWQMVIVALNTNGSLVTAIYLLGKEQPKKKSAKDKSES